MTRIGRLFTRIRFVFFWKSSNLIARLGCKKHRMFFRHSADKLIYPLIVLGALLFISYRPEYRLSAEMPADFFSPTISAGAQKHSLEQKIAWAYWESAQMDI